MWDEAERLLEKDKYLGLVVKKYRPCMIKPIAPKDYFEDLVSSIVGQQLSGKAAKTIFDRVKARVGKMTPKNVLAVDAPDLRKCGLSNSKASYVRNLAQHVIDGKLHLTKFTTHPDEAIIEELVAVKGIGRWTAEMFLMFALARPDVFPLDDLGIVKGMEKLTGKQMAKSEMAEFATRWAPWRTVASWYVWRALDG